MNTVLVTGSAGFLGRAVCMLLHGRGIRTVGVDPQQNEITGYQSFADDLTDRKRIAEYLAFYGVTHIIHCGGISSPALATPDRIIATNTGDSINLALAAYDANVRRLVFASSIAARNPQDAYGYSKAATELALRALNAQSPGRFLALRFAGIYGPGRRTAILPHDLIAAALNHAKFELPEPSVRHYIFIDDAAAAAVQACFAVTALEAFYDIAFPDHVTTLDLARAVQKLLPSFRFDVQQPGDALAPSNVDIAPATRDFGFTPQINAEAGIRRIIAWMSTPSCSRQKFSHAATT